MSLEWTVQFNTTRVKMQHQSHLFLYNYQCQTFNITSCFWPLYTHTHTHTRTHSSTTMVSPQQRHSKAESFLPSRGLLRPTIPPCLALTSSCWVPSSPAALTGNESLVTFNLTTSLTLKRSRSSAVPYSVCIVRHYLEEEARPLTDLLDF